MITIFPNIEEFCFTQMLTPSPINQYLESHFAGVDCWAEPGRFVSSSIALLVCRLVGKAVRDGRTHYYLNDGVYGCLSNKIFDFYDMSQLKIFGKNGLKQNDKQIATLFGPTCDSIDQLSDDVSSTIEAAPSLKRTMSSIMSAIGKLSCVVPTSGISGVPKYGIFDTMSLVFSLKLLTGNFTVVCSCF